MSDPATPRMRWWGWGTDGHDPAVPDGLDALLRAELGVDGRATPPVALDEVRLPEPALAGEARAALEAVVGASFVRDDRATRIAHATGRSYPDLFRLRSGDIECAPDAVVLPADADEVQRVLVVCAEHGVAVVPFGGGTSVVGGVEALRGRFGAVVALDLARLDRLVAADPRSLTATLQAGVTGPEAERLLAAHGLTLGHFPQSFEFSTVGGWVATRSAGQASTGHGRIDELVLGLECATPAGPVRALAVPATAAGPDLRELLVGSEGTLGVITEATLRVRPRPVAERYEAWAMPSFEAGAETLRTLEQRGAAPDVCRLSDAEETRLVLALAGRAGRALGAYLQTRGRPRPCLVIVGWDGPEDAVRRRRGEARRILREGGALRLGRRPGDAWQAGRFHGPYLRDVLMDRAVLVETLETATTWDRLQDLHAAVDAALRRSLGERGTPPFVGCHISHLYPTGASLYFTFVARQEQGAELEQWRAAKAAAGAAIVATGGTITHHHAIGRDHAPWLGAEVGELGLEVLRAAKARLDPAGIMNPGKLVPDP
jgi:alkyldihydroxyacetonephosphate synthase